MIMVIKTINISHYFFRWYKGTPKPDVSLYLHKDWELRFRKICVERAFKSYERECLLGFSITFNKMHWHFSVQIGMAFPGDITCEHESQSCVT